MKTKPPVTREDIVTLSDLVPRYDVKGGAGKRVFGATISGRPASGRSGKPTERKSPRHEPR
jgi:hypothetical protein